MERGRTFGSYFLFLIKEGLFRFRKEVWGWRGIVLVFIIAMMVFDAAELAEEGRFTLMYQGVGAIWVAFLFPPRMGKLLYLLPFSKKERIRYLTTYFVTYLCFHVLLFLFVGVIVYWIAEYPYLMWLRSFVFCTVPFVMLYGVTLTYSMSTAVRKSYPTSGWFFSTRGCWQQNTDAVAEIREDCRVSVQTAGGMTAEEKEKGRKQARFILVSVLVTIIPAFQCCGFWMLTELSEKFSWMVYISSALAYISALAGMMLYWNRISEELNKKGSAGKEECGCNS